MKCRSLFLISSLLVTPVAYSQAPIGSAGLYDANFNTTVRNEGSVFSTADGQMVIRTKGIANYVADTYVATFNLTVEESTKQEVDKTINQRLNGLKQELVGLGFVAENIKIDLVSLVPSFEIEAGSRFLSKSHVEKPNGFVCQKTITVVFNRSADLELIMSKALEFDVYDLVKVDYHLTSLSTKKKELKELCKADLAKKISETKQFVPLSDSLSNYMVNKFDVVYPASKYSQYQAYNADYSGVSKNKNVTYANKPLTKYYNQIEYSNYDVVVNPIVTEPVIQITYEVGVVYKNANTKNKDTYKLITPNGSIVNIGQ